MPGCTKRYTDPSSLRKHVKNHSGKDHAHAQVRRAGSTGSASSAADSEASTHSGECGSHVTPSAANMSKVTTLYFYPSQICPSRPSRRRVNCTRTRSPVSTPLWCRQVPASCPLRDDVSDWFAFCYFRAVGDVGLDDALFPSADDIDQAIREFIPFDEVGKMLAEPSGKSKQNDYCKPCVCSDAA